MLGPLDDYLLVEGTHRQLYKRLGAHSPPTRASRGVHLRGLGAATPARVSVVGDFNGWDGRRRQMRKRVDSGLWEIFVPASAPGVVYKYEIVSAPTACCSR